MEYDFCPAFIRDRLLFKAAVYSRKYGNLFCWEIMTHFRYRPSRHHSDRWRYWRFLRNDISKKYNKIFASPGIYVTLMPGPWVQREHVWMVVSRGLNCFITEITGLESWEVKLGILGQIPPTDNSDRYGSYRKLIPLEFTVNPSLIPFQKMPQHA